MLPSPQHLLNHLPPLQYPLTRPATVAIPPDAMSVKFEKETTKTTAAVADAVSGKGSDDILHHVGEALTKGAGPNGYLAVSFAQLRLLLGGILTGDVTGVP